MSAKTAPIIIDKHLFSIGAKTAHGLDIAI